MALLRSTLQDGLRVLFSSPPDSAALCAETWAAVMRDYSRSVTPVSTSVDVAYEALYASLSSIFSASSTLGSAPTVATQMEIAWFSFAVTLGSGMSGGGYVATPPPSIVGFIQLFNASPKPSTHEEAAINFSSRIDTWMRTGIATSSGGVVQPWS